MFARRLLLALAQSIAVANDVGVTSIKDHGATGDGSTDDTAAIDAALSAIASAGRGVLWFPPGDYLTTGDHEITVPCVVMGMGGGGGKTLAYQGGGLDVGFVSRVVCTDASNRLFGVSSSSVEFTSIGLANLETAPAGALIETLATGGDHALYEGVTFDIQGLGLKHHYGREWKFLGNWLHDATMQIQNLDAADEMEALVAHNHFICNDWNADAVIEVLRSGGLHIVGNTSIALGPSDATSPTTIVKINLSDPTSNIFIRGNAFENYTDSAIYKTGATVNTIGISDNEFNGGRATNKQDVVIVNAADAMIHDNVHVGNGQNYNPVSLTTVSGGRIHDNRWRNFNGAISSYFTGGSGIVAHDN